MTTIRAAKRNDVPEILRLLADDEIGRLREDTSGAPSTAYYEAFEIIDRDVNHELIVAEDENLGVIGTLQLSFLQYLTYRGGLRANIEAVRIRGDSRGKGVGTQLLQWAIARAKERGAHLLQLTSDKRRGQAQEFYKRLGFEPTHVGMKLNL